MTKFVNRNHKGAYSSWRHMKERCSNPNYRRYENYGGRGIKVCDRWQNDFRAFYDDMGDRPAGKTIDRIDNDGDYSPENCKWSTASEQEANKRAKRLSLLRVAAVTV